MKGKYNIDIEKNRGKVQHMVNWVKQIGSEHKMGKMSVVIRLKLMEAVVLPSILYNIEAFSAIEEDEYRKLDCVQGNILKQLLEIPNSTPYQALLLETGVLPMKARVAYKK